MSPARVPVEPSDIRAGDLIRWEKRPGSPDQAFEACEFVAKHAGEGRRNHDGAHFLLDRPKPAVVLPTTVNHHFGWLAAPSSRVNGTQPGEWHFGDDAITASGFPEPIRREAVTEWVAGTLVPTDALEKLREVARTKRSGYLNVADLDAFLAAVDATDGANQ